jgi:hypothetical protein
MVLVVTGFGGMLADPWAQAAGGTVADSASTSPTSTSPTEPRPLPEWKDVQAAVAGHFAGQAAYQPGDLLSQGEVTPLFPKLAALNWTVVDSREITALLLPDNDFLVTQLQTRAGRKFMRRIAHLPGGYDRIDRLRGMDRGRQRVRELIQGPDGDKLIEYLTTTPQGKNLGRSLSQGTGGKEFNKPTQKLYTEQDLLRRLQTSYQAEAARRQALLGAR